MLSNWTPIISRRASDRALAYIEQGNFSEALSDCNQALKQDPRYTSPYWHRAECANSRSTIRPSLT